MAWRVGNQAFKLFRLRKSEIILQKLSRNDNTVLVKQYKNFLNNLKHLQSADLVILPFKSFGPFPAEILNSIIAETFTIVKNKNIKDTYTYNAFIRNYIENGIEFNLTDILKEMKENKIQFNKGTYNLLIKIHCELGKMDSVETLLEKMKLKKLEIDFISKMHLISGYIIAGQLDKSKEISLEYDNDIALIWKAKGFASIGDIKRVLQVISTMDERIDKYSPSIYFEIFRRLVKTNTPERDLMQIIELMKEVNDPTLVCETVFYLNRAGFYYNSLKLVEIFQEKLTDSKAASNLITSFNSSDCPLDIYKRLLKMLINYIGIRWQRNLFSKMSYDEAFELGESLVDVNNNGVILTSLFNNAINNKSWTSIKNSIEFGFEHSNTFKLNSVLQFYVIPSLVKSRMASSYSEILDTLPQYRSLILPVTLMHILCIGDIHQYNIIIDHHNSSGHIFYSINLKATSRMVMSNYYFSDIGTLIVAASKMFTPGLVNRLVSYVIIEKIIMSSKSYALNGIDEAVLLAKEFNVSFTPKDLEVLTKKASKHQNLFQCIINKNSESIPINESSNKKIV